MEPARRPWIAALVYAAGSVVAAPAIVVASLLYTRGGGDYCDPVYDGDPSGRATEFAAANAAMSVASGFFLVAGLGVLAILARRRTSVSGPVLALSVVGTLVVMGGYAFMAFGWSIGDGQAC